MDGLEHKKEGGKTPQKDTPESVVTRAKKRLTDCKAAVDESRKQSMDQLRFRHGDQWEEKARKKREATGRACLTVNRVPGFVQSITNDQRQNRPAIHVNPVDESADPDVAKIYQGLIRHIEYDSGADMAYDTAHDYAVSMGFGFYKIETDFVSPQSFQQEIKIKPIYNPFRVYFDHLSVAPDGSDAKWHLEFLEPMSTDEFKRTFPDVEPVDFSIDSGHNTQVGETDTVQAVEYFEVIETPMQLHLLRDGSTVYHDELQPAMKPHIIKTRDSYRAVIRGYQLSGDAVLSQSDWPIDILPMIPTYGVVTYVDGKRLCYGLVKDLMDPARMYNFWITTSTELVAEAPKPAYLVAEGQIAGYENQWVNAHSDNLSYRTYIPKSINGTVLGPPTREQFAGIPSGVIQMLQLAAEDMKATTGIYDAGLGARSNETSGIAITARQKESEVSNFHYQDNFNRSHRHCGRILLALIPKIIDTPQAVRILGEDNKAQVVQLFQPPGMARGTNLSIGKYDATVTPGPSFTTKREEFAQKSLELAQAVPELWKIAGHLIIKAMNWPNADEIADLWQGAFAQQTGQGGEQGGLPEEAQVQMQAAEQQIQQLTAQLEQVSAQLENKQMAEEIKARVAVEIERIRATSRLDVEEFKAAASLVMRGVTPPQNWLESDQQHSTTERGEPAAPVDPATPPGDEETYQ